MENLSRAIGSTWRYLWPGLRKLRHPPESGRGLTGAEELALKRAVQGVRIAAAQTIVYVALATGIRSAVSWTLTATPTRRSSARRTRIGTCSRSAQTAGWTLRSPSTQSRPPGIRFGTARASSAAFTTLRHHVATKMAEAGVPESPMCAILGHMSRNMLERYSHIREQAKQGAVAVLSLHTPDLIETSTKVTTSEASERVH